MYSTPKLHHYNGDVSKAWYVSFYIQQPSGEWKEYQRRGGINYEKNKNERLKEGRALCKAIENKLKDGWTPEGYKDSPLTLIEAIEEIQKLKASSFKPKSLRNYKDITGIFKKWLKEKGYTAIHAAQFDTSAARKYLDYLVKEKAYSGSTHNNNLDMMRACFNSMKERKWVEVNPFTGIKRLPTDTGKNIAYSEQEARELIKYFKENDKRMYYAVNFVFHGFIRKTELCTIKVGDIDLENMTIKLNSKDTKNRIQDSVTITPGLMSVIKELFDTYKIDMSKRSWYLFGKGLLPGPDKCTRPDDLSDLFLKLKRKAGVGTDKQSFYSFKHTGVIAYWKAIKDPYAIQRQCRHSDLRVTMIYLKSLGLQPNTPFINANVKI